MELEPLVITPTLKKQIAISFADIVFFILSSLQDVCTLSYDVTPGSVIMTCIKIDKPLVIYIF